MKVKDLIKKLQACDPNTEVMISVDEEGNDFKKFEDVEDNDDYFMFGGEVCHKEDYSMPEMKEMKMEKIIILWP